MVFFFSNLSFANNCSIAFAHGVFLHFCEVESYPKVYARVYFVQFQRTFFSPVAQSGCEVLFFSVGGEAWVDGADKVTAVIKQIRSAVRNARKPRLCGAVGRTQRRLCRYVWQYAICELQIFSKARNGNPTAYLFAAVAAGLLQTLLERVIHKRWKPWCLPLLCPPRRRRTVSLSGEKLPPLRNNSLTQFVSQSPCARRLRKFPLPVPQRTLTCQVE